MAATPNIDAFTGMAASRFGVYIHFPYCLSKCPYCDFASTVAPKVPQERYAAAIVRELSLRAAASSSALPLVESIYFGGGTPSLWDARWVQEVLSAVRQQLEVTEDAEVTLEANPGAADASRFAAFREAGVNRLSIGIQSFQPRLLAFLGRGHSAEEAEAAVRAAREAGFDNLSVDIIYGSPGQTVKEARADAERALALHVEHLSAYALTLEPEALAEPVPLSRQLSRGEIALPADEVVVQMEAEVRAACAEAGLFRYETSNYARAGFHSRHNCLYWTGGGYLALGSGATGCLYSGTQARRYQNPRSAEAYLTAVEQGRVPDASVEQLSGSELFSERLAMGLRLSTGVDIEGVCKAFGKSWPERRPKVERLLKEGLAEMKDGRVALTFRGADLHSAICAEIL